MKRILLTTVALTLLFTQAFAQNETELGGLTEEKKQQFASSQPEDITNENFPELIKSFDYPNADITEVIQAISTLTGINFIVDPSVKGKVTIIAPSQITVAEAYKAFLSALSTLNYTVIPSGKFWKIKQSRNAKFDSIETYSGNYFPVSDQIITRIIKLKYISSGQVEKDLRGLHSKDGELTSYDPTNSLIITDYGSNIARIVKIINELDVPGFEDKLAVIAIRNAKAKDMAELVSQIINKGEKKTSSRFSSSRFNRNKKTDTKGGSENLDLVIPDDRTNSIIVVGNDAGVAKIKSLVKKLDFKLSADEAGGIHVYYVKHGEAEAIAKTLNGIAKEAKASASQSSTSSRSKTAAVAPTIQAPLFGGDVKIAADKQTNSLIVTADKKDYDVVKNLLAKIDISRDQVFVKVVIMEMNANDTFKYGVNIIKFDDKSGGIGRVGFQTADSLGSLLDPLSSGAGLLLGFGGGNDFALSDSIPSVGGKTVPSMIGFIDFLKTNANGNILSTPQIMALNNEDALIEVGAKVPVKQTTSTGANGVTQGGIETADAKIKLELTPFISPDSDVVRMKIKQQVGDVGEPVTFGNSGQVAYPLNEKVLETVISAESGSTVVLGGLMTDTETDVIKKIPVLGDIPVLGWLFKSKLTEKRKKNLLLFITPEIIRSQENNGDLLTRKINERIDFVQRWMKGRDPHGALMDSFNPQTSSNSAPIIDDTEKEEPAVETF